MPRLLPSCLPNTSAPPTFITKLYPTAFTPHVYVSQAGLPPRNTRFRWMVSLHRLGTCARWSQKGVSDSLICSLFSSPFSFARRNGLVNKADSGYDSMFSRRPEHIVQALRIQNHQRPLFQLIRVGVADPRFDLGRDLAETLPDQDVQ